MAAITGAARAWLPAARTRAAIAKRLAAAAPEVTTAALAEIDQRHDWFAELDAEHRSWVSLVARAGIDGFVAWFAGDANELDPSHIFDAAPRALMRRISLHQTVDLVKTTIDTVEAHIESMPRGDRPTLNLAIMQYSREVAFAAAEVYARAAEERGGWDERLEALVVDAVIRGEIDETVAARAATLGWRALSGLAVVVGNAPDEVSDAMDAIRKAAGGRGFDVLVAPQGDRLLLLIGCPSHEARDLLVFVDSIGSRFGPGHIVAGPLVADLDEAVTSARAALSGMRAADAWAAAPRAVSAEDLLPERALAGDGHARRMLAREVYAPLRDAGADLLETLVQFHEQGSSIEAAARALFVHPNTVRYRLRRIAEVTGYHPSDSRGSYVLRLAVTLGRLLS